MRFSIIGPTHIPPVGWGAVESLIWDYKLTLEKLGHEVDIINVGIQERSSRESIRFALISCIFITMTGLFSILMCNILVRVPPTLPTSSAQTK